MYLCCYLDVAMASRLFKFTYMQSSSQAVDVSLVMRKPSPSKCNFVGVFSFDLQANPAENSCSFSGVHR